MIKVSVLYANTEGNKFDWDYYSSKHIPLLKQLLGAACKRVEVDQGLAGGQPSSKAPFVALAHMFFDSVESFQQAFGPHAGTIMSDVSNYTDIQPIVQINAVRM